MKYKVNFNEYLYIEFIYENGNIKVTYDKGIPSSVYCFEENENEFVLKCCNKKVGTLDKKTGEFHDNKLYITTLEIKNYSLYKSSKKRDYNKNRKMFEKNFTENTHYPIELHTHFMEVLSSEEFLEVISEYLNEIPIDKDGNLAICGLNSKDYCTPDYSNVTFMPIEEALKNPKLLEQLRLPIDRQVDFSELSNALKKRNALINLISYNLASKELKETKNLTLPQAKNICSTYKPQIYYKLLKKSLEVLKDQGVKYVEFSYSNKNTLIDIIKLVRANKLNIEGIIFKFLLSTQRSNGRREFKINPKSLPSILKDYPEVVGFDLMGQEQEITEYDEEKKHGDTCDNLYSKLKFTVINLLNSPRNKPTLRLHAGEFFYKEENSRNNNPYLILNILKNIEEELQEENGKDFKLADKLDIRIGHGLHFQDIPEYYSLLKYFNVIVEICASSNFALSNITDLEKIPYKKYIENNIPFVVGTDGGGFYLTTLKGELRNAAIQNLGTVMDRLTKTQNAFDNDVTSPTEFIRDKIFSLKTDYTVDDYLRDNYENIHDTEFVKLYEQAEDKRKFVTEYFKKSGITEIVDKVKKELVRTQAFYHDRVVNEAYYDTSEEIVISNSFVEIQNLIDQKKYYSAALVLVSLQAVMGCEIKLYKLLYLIKQYNVDFNNFLTLDVKKAKYNLDIPIENHFDNSTLKIDTLTKEFNEVIEKISTTRYSELDVSILYEKIKLTEYYIKENDLTKAAISIVCLQEYLGMNVTLREVKMYMDENGYSLSDYFSQDDIQIGGRKI